MKLRIVNRTRRVAAVAGIMLALAGASFAGGPVTSTPHRPKSANTKANKGSLKISASTEINGVVLEPGEYEVKQVNSAAGPVVRFTRYTYNLYAPEGLPSQQWDFVAEVAVTTKPLAAKAGRTELLLASNGNKPIGLQIRGNNLDYFF